MKFKKIKNNLIASVVGSLIGITVSLIYINKFWLPTKSSEIGLGIVSLLPIALVMYISLGIIIGSLLGILIYQIFKRVGKN